MPNPIPPHLRRLALVGLLALGLPLLGGLAGCETDTPPCATGPNRPLPGTLLGGQARIPTSLAFTGVPGGLEYEVPVNRGEVYLADAAGQALPGRVALTSSNGAYQLAGVPPGHAFGVVVAAKTAQGKDMLLRTLARTSNQGGTADVNGATTIATLAVCEGLTGPVGDFDRTAFERLVANVYGRLPAASTLDLSDTPSVLERFRVWYAQDADLRALVDRLRVEVSRPRVSLADQAAALLQAQGLPVAPPSALTRATSAPARPTASPTAGATTSPGPTASPRPSASPTPRPTASPGAG